MPVLGAIAAALIGGGVQPEGNKAAGANAGVVKAAMDANTKATQTGGSDSEAYASKATASPLGEGSVTSMMDNHFYGHMTIEKCIKMSGSNSTLKSDKSSFAKNQTNGMHTGKKGK